MNLYKEMIQDDIDISRLVRTDGKADMMQFWNGIEDRYFNSNMDIIKLMDILLDVSKITMLNVNVLSNTLVDNTKENPIESTLVKKEEEKITDIGLNILNIGQLVIVAKRSWPGMNRDGGVGKIHKRIHKNENGINRYLYTVKYTLGGSEKNVERHYIKKTSTCNLSEDILKSKDFTFSSPVLTYPEKKNQINQLKSCKNKLNFSDVPMDLEKIKKEYINISSHCFDFLSKLSFMIQEHEEHRSTKEKYLNWKNEIIKNYNTNIKPNIKKDEELSENDEPKEESFFLNNNSSKTIIQKTFCSLCLLSGGEFVSTTDSSQFVHPMCAIYTPETYFKNGVVHNIENIPLEREKLRCSACKGTNGKNKIQCQYKHCIKAYHTQCAKRESLLISDDRKKKFFCRCKQHIKSYKIKKNKSNISGKNITKTYGHINKKAKRSNDDDEKKDANLVPFHGFTKNIEEIEKFKLGQSTELLTQDIARSQKAFVIDNKVESPPLNTFASERKQDMKISHFLGWSPVRLKIDKNQQILNIIASHSSSVNLNDNNMKKSYKSIADDYMGEPEVEITEFCKTKRKRNRAVETDETDTVQN